MGKRGDHPRSDSERGHPSSSLLRDHIAGVVDPSAPPIPRSCKLLEVKKKVVASLNLRVEKRAESRKRLIEACCEMSNEYNGPDQTAGFYWAVVYLLTRSLTEEGQGVHTVDYTAQLDETLLFLTDIQSSYLASFPHVKFQFVKRFSEGQIVGYVEVSFSKSRLPGISLRRALSEVGASNDDFITGLHTFGATVDTVNGKLVIRQSEPEEDMSVRPYLN